MCIQCSSANMCARARLRQHRSDGAAAHGAGGAREQPASEAIRVEEVRLGLLAAAGEADQLVGRLHVAQADDALDVSIRLLLQGICVEPHLRMDVRS